MESIAVVLTHGASVTRRAGGPFKATKEALRLCNLYKCSIYEEIRTSMLSFGVVAGSLWR